MPPDNLHVIHNLQQGRFEIHLDSQIAVLNYRINDGSIIFTHTGVPAALEGRGMGSLLVKTGLTYARENKLSVQSLCWFVDGYLRRHEADQNK
jgi:predicted GNAT family acetyltransferase